MHLDQHLQGMQDELEKIALPRYEKAIQEGVISRGDVAPGVQDLPGVFSPISKKLTRDKLMEPSPADPVALERKRVLRGKLYKNTMSRAGELVPGVLDSGTNYVPGFAGAREMPEGGVTTHVHEGTGPFTRWLPGKSNRQVTNFNEKLHKELMDPKRDARQPVRTLEESLPAPHPMDNSINYAAAHHELEESKALLRGEVRQVASHLDVDPIAAEKLRVVGDPDAMKAFADLRTRDPGDRYAEKVLRSVGSTPDSPIPLEGKQLAAAKRIIDQHPERLDQTSRARAMTLIDHPMISKERPAPIPTELPIGEPAWNKAYADREKILEEYRRTAPRMKTTYIPEGVKNPMNIMQRLKERPQLEEFHNLTNPGLLNRAKFRARNAKELVGELARNLRFLNKGK